jgi:hypothetical protein
MDAAGFEPATQNFQALDASSSRRAGAGREGSVLKHVTDPAKPSITKCAAAST